MYIRKQHVPVAPRFWAWVFGCSVAGFYRFESRRRHGCLSLVSVVCCQVGVLSSGWSLVQGSPTECGVSECDLETSTMSLEKKNPPTHTHTRIGHTHTHTHTYVMLARLCGILELPRPILVVSRLSLWDFLDVILDSLLTLTYVILLIRQSWLLTVHHSAQLNLYSWYSAVK